MNSKTPMRGLSAVAAAAMILAAGASGRVQGKARDVSFGFRCPAGFPGDVNRAHPFSVEPALIDVTNPPSLYGCALVVNTAANSVRGLIAGDTTVTRLYGILCRDYPTQQSSTTNNGAAAIGTSVPPTSGAASVARDAYIMVRVNGTPTKDGAVFVWVAASSGNHIQGTFEAAATGGSTAAIANARFNGPPDTSGNVELIIFATGS